MAIFQTNEPHPDVNLRRTITTEDIAFMTKLQTVLNTQSTMGNAQPVFWVIKGETENHVDANPSDATHIIFEAEAYDVSTQDGIYEFLTSDAVREQAKTYELEYRVERTKDGTPNVFVESIISNVNETIEDPDDLYYFLIENMNVADSDIRMTVVEQEPHVYPGTLFLTHAACQEHLRNYGYNYDPSAHAYAMTATRSTELERLLDVIRSVRWDAIPTSSPQKGESTP